jgi:hypothetical protein
MKYIGRPWQLAREVVKLQKEAQTYRRQIGGHKASFTEIKNNWTECKLTNGCIDSKISDGYEEAE